MSKGAGEHTSGPVTVDEHRPSWIKSRADENVIAVCEPDCNHKGESKSNAARLAACWNACEHYSTETLQASAEKMILGPATTAWGIAAIARMDELRAENERLREALQAIVDSERPQIVMMGDEPGEPFPLRYRPLIENARAALKATAPA